MKINRLVLFIEGIYYALNYQHQKKYQAALNHDKSKDPEREDKKVI